MANDKRILIIAGSDSSGGAYVLISYQKTAGAKLHRGLEADQKVIAAHGCYAMTATTALTAQNTQGVQDIFHIPPEFVKRQIEACIDDIGVDVVKTASARTVEAIAEALESHGRPIAVVDPVMMSTSGAQLLPTDAVRVFREQILPLATVLTPNIPEAKLLLQDAGQPVSDPQTLDDLIEYARAIIWTQITLTEQAAHLHVGSRTWFYLVTSLRRCEAAIASNLALGYDIPDAVQKACRYVEAGIRLSIDRGRGSGPINHFHSTYMLPFVPLVPSSSQSHLALLNSIRGRFVEFLLSQAAEAWRTYTEHEFVQLLADGSLQLENFQHYLKQDYIFLTQLARSRALGAYNMKSMPAIVAGAKGILQVEQEMNAHLTFCETYGISRLDIESANPSQGFLMDVGHSEDWFALQVAVAPCFIGYGAIARRLYEDSKTVKGHENKYWKWIETYVSDEYVETVSQVKDVLEKYAVSQSPSRTEELVKIFKSATRVGSIIK
ncbi:MAG: hypothetical protein Q9187_001405 [Circinaria calcarea]